MAKFEATIKGKLQPIAQYIEEHERDLGMTCSQEEKIEGEIDGTRYWMTNYERFAVIGGNRCSLTVLLMEYSEGVKVIATAAGGSNAAFLKVNHWDEDAFIEVFRRLVDKYQGEEAERK